MQTTNDARWSGIALIGAGVGYALFWSLLLPLGTLVGAHVVHDPLWVPAQWIHVVGALLALFGIMGLYVRLRSQTSLFRRISFVMAVIGTVLFFVDGMFALVLFPAVADQAPALLNATGAFFTGPVAIAFIVFAATNMIGNLLLGGALLQSGLFPRGAVMLNLLGSVLFNLPPGPVPLIILVTGAILWGISAVWLGWHLLSTSQTEQ